MYLEIKVRVGKTTEEGLVKKVTENYLVDAVTFGEAETRITEEVAPYVSDGVEVLSMKQAHYSEIIKGEKSRWYAVKFAFITIDERSGKEKRTHCSYLFNAESVDEAKTAFVEHMRSSMMDWEIKAVSETSILEVFFHE